jgi:2-keto-4-pentenoate hydratase/2-oxohepta-3-ene-1,7-dioic acid hydratase in catechol pathway
LKIGFFNKKGEGGGFFGEVTGDRVARLGDDFKRTGEREENLSGLIIQAPARPTKIVAVGLNYKRHSEEMKEKIPLTPLLFLKPSSSVLRHKGSIVYPAMSGRVDFEAELAVVIKYPAKNIPPQEAPDYILGYTAFNDVTARDLQSGDGQWTRAKSFDTFAPFGPFIDTVLDPAGLKIQALHNGRVRQDSNTSNMIFDVFTLVSFISKVMTLYPGDVIATGTPEGVGEMKAGDEIIIRIEGLDDLVNTVI